jgi:hypothetical protein
MEGVYKHDYYFDLLAHPEGKLYALKLFLDFMLEHLYGTEGQNVLQTLVQDRLSLLDFTVFEKDLGSICEPNAPMWVSHAMAGTIELDARIIAPIFMQFEPHVMDFLFHDFVEEITANIVTTFKTRAFLQQCFRGQPYEFTSPDSELHATLWNVLQDEEDQQQ